MKRRMFFLFMFSGMVLASSFLTGCVHDSNAKALKLGPTSTPEHSSTQIIYLVRHAEKSKSPAEDPALTEMGRTQAYNLIHALSETGIDTIITTEWQRSKATAEPLANALHIKPYVIVSVQSGGVTEHVQAVAEAVKESPSRALLIVGHSNTVPMIIQALGGPQLPQLTDDAYDNIFVLTRTDSAIQLAKLKY